MKIALNNYIVLFCTLIPSFLSGMISILKEKHLANASYCLKGIKCDIDKLIDRAATPVLMLNTIRTLHMYKKLEPNKQKLFSSEMGLETIDLLIQATTENKKIPHFKDYSLSELQDALLSITPHLEDQTKNKILEKIYPKNYESLEWLTLHTEIFKPNIEILKLQRMATIQANIEYEQDFRVPAERSDLI